MHTHPLDIYMAEWADADLEYVNDEESVEYEGTDEAPEQATDEELIGNQTATNNNDTNASDSDEELTQGADKESTQGADDQTDEGSYFDEEVTIDNETPQGAEKCERSLFTDWYGWMCNSSPWRINVRPLDHNRQVILKI